ncbi:MAG: hypothetical protein WBW48_04155 [Anaerolineae bacterium]
MTEEIERLLELGRMDLEAGYPEYARQYFEKVLALDATNQEAIDALARIDEILSRKATVPVKPIQHEPAKPSPKAVTKGKVVYGLAAVFVLAVVVILVWIAYIMFIEPRRQVAVAPTAAAISMETPKPTPTLKPLPTPTGKPPVPTMRPTPTPKPTKTPVPPTSTPVPPTETPIPQLKPITLTGRGDDVVNVDKPDVPAIARISTTQSGGNFAVISYDSSGNRIGLLVNKIGSYSGTRPIDFFDDEHTGRFEVKADGSWRIEILPLTSARSLSVPGRISGTGDDVIILRGSTPGVATISHRGDSNFAVIAYGTLGRDLLVNEIGSYDGKVIVSDYAIALEMVADGNWSVDISSK